jgi:hypothetical protein
MLLGVFGIGAVELLVMGIVLLLLVGVPIGVVVAVVLLVRRTSVAQFPPPAGPPKVLRALRPEDEPISGGAKWHGNELEVASDGPGPQRLFEVPLPGIDHSMLTYRFRIQTEGLEKPVYPEMWCRVVGVGEAFSRGLHQKIRGTNNWTSLEIPFYLKEGQFADLLKLNLVFEGSGTVRLSDIEVLATPLQAKTA